MFSTNAPRRAAFPRLAVLLAALAAPLPSLAAAPELLLAAPAAGSPAAATVRFNARAALALARGEEALLTLPRLGTLAVVHDRREQHPDGDVTWAGYFKEWGGDYRVVFTLSADGTLAGRVASPDGEFSLVPAPAGGARLVDRKMAPAAPVVVDEDDAVPAPEAPKAMAPRAPAMAAMAATASAPAAGAATANTTIDLMVVYTPAIAKRYGKRLRTRLNHLVAVTNQAYTDSGVKITLRLVHVVQASYNEKLGTNRALKDLTYGVGGFSGISALRKRYGADLVQLIMSPSAPNICGGGEGWIASPVVAERGYSVFYDNYPGQCRDAGDVIMAHELGHNMGANHDRAHVGSKYGVDFKGYSFGYGIPGKFADVMSASYVNAPVVAKFSNPYAKCGPDRVPCGIVPGKPGAADSARTLNDNRRAVAAFMPAADAPFAALSASPATVDYGKAATLTWSSARATACTASRGWSGRKALKGKASFKLKASATFTLTCAGPKGTASATATVRVNPPPVQVSATAGPVACVFDWFEKKYPKLYPANDPKKQMFNDSSRLSAERYYPSTQEDLEFIALGKEDRTTGIIRHVGRSTGNDSVSLGTLAKWMAASGCK